MLNETEFDSFKQNVFSVVSSVADKAELDGDGDIVFTDGEATYALIFQERDPGFIRFLLPNFLSIEHAMSEALDQAMRLNYENKLATIVFNDKGRASITIDLLASSVDYLDKPMLKRLIKSMDSAAFELYQKMKSESIPKSMLQ